MVIRVPAFVPLGWTYINAEDVLRSIHSAIKGASGLDWGPSHPCSIGTPVLTRVLNPT